MSENENKLLTPFIEKTVRLKEVNSTVLTPDIVLNDLLPTKIERYFRYSGSLTTPGCDEIVEWFVVDSPILTLSKSQIAKLQTIKGLNGKLVIKTLNQFFSQDFFLLFSLSIIYIKSSVNNQI